MGCNKSKHDAADAVKRRSLRDELGLEDDERPVTCGTVLTAHVRRDGSGLNVSCTNLAGEETFTCQMDSACVIADLEAAFLSQDGLELAGTRKLSEFSLITVKELRPDVVSREKFSVDVRLPDGREVRVDGLAERDSCLAARRSVFEKAGMDLNELDDFVLVYYEQWMHDECALHYFGLPWNGRQLKLEKKSSRLKSIALGSG
eukprot:CAMPEP_0117623728 /NCGR_PEP_ID=MMETSP0784-20121206/88793_1 /TAXON_ID=39447 /ORGANISM="" /LENGTH=202 /DNA_ID=CAMNT_0005427681 /DNA_START=59 /DNA_END=664 /DNA_ORIENTATION=-